MARRQNTSKKIKLPPILAGLLFLCIAIAAVFTSIVLYRHIPAENEPGKKNAMVQEKEYLKQLRGTDALVFRDWSRRIDDVGGKEAYQELKNKYKDLKPYDAHLYSHLFGTLLYIKLGAQGVSVCDDAFAYGCYHSYMGKAIQDQGIGVVNTLGAHCAENLRSMKMNPGGCHHGIGHGILSYYGYTFHSLQRALATCYEFKNENEITPCEAGVYMEYDFRFMLLDEKATREFQENDPESPCKQLADNLKPYCYFSHGRWMIESLTGTYPERFKKIGKICSAVEGEENKTQCFAGPGHVVGMYANYSIPTARQLCKQFSPYGIVYVNSCLSAAKGAYIYFNVPDAETLYDGPAIAF